MTVKEITSVGILELFQDILSINKRMQELTVKSGSPEPNEKARLTDKASYLLDQCRVTFEITDATYFDVITFKSFGDIEILTQVRKQSPFSESYDLEFTHPDLYQFFKESDAILSEIAKANPPLASQITQIGTIKLHVLLTIRGTSILSLFNGFMEDYIYKFFGYKDTMNEEEDIPKIHGYIYSVFTELVIKRSQQNGIKKGLVEDFLINKKFFSFVNDTEVGNIVTPAKIIYPEGSITFFTKDPNTVYKDIEKFNKYLEKRTVYTDENLKDISVIFCCCSDMINFLMFKAENPIHAEIIAEEPIDVIYGKERKYKVTPEFDITFGVRYKNLNEHNKKFKEILKQDHSKYALSLPYNIYNMIQCGIRTKYLVEVRLSEYKYQVKQVERSRQLVSQMVDGLRSIDALLFSNK
jgi:hypothetical protein